MNKYILLGFIIFLIMYAYMMMEPDIKYKTINKNNRIDKEYHDDIEIIYLDA